MSFPEESKVSSYKFIIRTDDSFLSDQCLTGIGWTLNNDQDNLMATRAAPIRSDNALKAELIVIVAGINEITLREILNFLFLIDSLSLYKFISGVSTDHSEEVEIIGQ